MTQIEIQNAPQTIKSFVLFLHGLNCAKLEYSKSAACQCKNTEVCFYLFFSSFLRQDTLKRRAQISVIVLSG
jgi:hypothetical protein